MKIANKPPEYIAEVKHFREINRNKLYMQEIKWKQIIFLEHFPPICSESFFKFDIPLCVSDMNRYDQDKSEHHYQFHTKFCILST
jgi:hypothetical protein